MADEYTWPPFLQAGRSTLRDLVDGLGGSQWWSADELRAGQARQLEWLLRRAMKSVPWYGQAAWGPATLAAAAAGTEQFWDAWQAIPVVQKTELRAHAGKFRARSLAAAHLPVALIQTSGSTGVPVEVQTTSLSRLVWDALTVREHLWRRRDFAKKLGVIRYSPRDQRDVGGRRFPSWGAPVSTLYSTGPASIIHIGLPIPQLADWLTRFDPHYLLTYPSVAAALLDILGGQSRRPVSLEEVRCISEPLDLLLEQRLRDEWGVRVADIYSANEVGYIALRCPEAEHLHVQSESVLVEILDEQGRPCATGETGRVVITGLHNLASPLLRYELGDYATVGPPCACGRGLPVIGQVLGRVRNLVRTPDNRTSWPVGLPAISVIKPIRQAQFVQTALDTIELRVVLDRPLTEDETVQAVRKVRDLLGYPFRVEICPVETIPRGPTGKFEEFLSALPG